VPLPLPAGSSPEKGRAPNKGWALRGSSRCRGGGGQHGGCSILITQAYISC